MSDPSPPPPPGSLYLFDHARPSLEPGHYRVTASTTVGFDGEQHELAATRHFDVEGPRFTLPPDEISAVYPPRGSEGDYDELLPHVVLRRRALPWERALDPQNLIPAPARGPGDPPPPAEPPPWLALLLLEEGEYTLIEAAALEEVVPPGVFARLGSPAGVLCDAVELPRETLRAILPAKEELSLLAHVRWVSSEDRALGAEAEGWFATVVANRLPRAGARCRACLVSLEQRADVCFADPPRSIDDPTSPTGGVVSGAVLAQAEVFASSGGPFTRPPDRVVVFPPPPPNVRLVLLHSWMFTAAGTGSFRSRMQNLDVGVLGATPPASDTGHVPMTLGDRAGYEQTTWYRGPAVPLPQSRDTLGPYHSADQALRVSPETGALDISYAAAFELGRLLAAADPRLAQEILAWRRAAFTRGAKADLAAALGQLGFVPAEVGEAGPPASSAPWRATLGVLGELARSAAKTVDPTGLADTKAVPGLDATALASVWGLASAETAKTLLDPEASVLGAALEVEEP